MVASMATSFELELQSLLNRHSRESASGTPDFILAEYLSGCLSLFHDAVNRREAWHGRVTSAPPTPLTSPADTL